MTSAVGLAQPPSCRRLWPPPTSRHVRIYPLPGDLCLHLRPKKMLKLSLLAAADELRQVTGVPTTLLPHVAGEKLSEEAIRSYGEPLGEAAGMVNRSVEAMAVPGKDGEMLPEKLDEIWSWLSGDLTDHETCLEGLGEAGVVEIRGLMMAAIKNSSELTRNSLAIATCIVPILNKLGLKLHR